MFIITSPETSNIYTLNKHHHAPSRGLPLDTRIPAMQMIVILVSEIPTIYKYIINITTTSTPASTPPIQSDISTYITILVSLPVIY